MGLILTTLADYDGIRALLGNLDPNLYLPNSILDTIPYIPTAELVVRKLVAGQVPNGVRTVDQILALDDSDTDKIALKAATIAYVCYLTTPGMSNLVNTAVSDGEQSIDLGGIGSAWDNMGTKYLDMTGYYLSLLENWQLANIAVFFTGGPSKAGNESDTLSGFFPDRYPF